MLRTEGLAAPADRPLPEQLCVAMAELGALRNVLIHRGGRVDARALKQAPTLRYADGDFVRIASADYRRYSAAVNCYASELWFRSIRSWPEVSDEEDGPKLDQWHNYYRLGA